MGGTAEFEMVLTVLPTEGVAVRLVSSAPDEGTLSHELVTFTPADWNIPQTITVTGVDDQVADGDQPFWIVTGWAVSLDGRYHGIDPHDLQLVNREGERTSPPNLPGDYNRDGTVDAIDMTIFRDTLGSHVPPFSGADGSGNGIVDSADYDLWKTSFVGAMPPDSPTTLVADYNQDGAVNTADFTVYRDSLGESVTPYSGADGNGNGIVDFPDYQIWKDQLEAVAFSESLGATPALAEMTDPARTRFSRDRARADETRDLAELLTENRWKGKARRSVNHSIRDKLFADLL